MKLNDLICWVINSISWLIKQLTQHLSVLSSFYIVEIISLMKMIVFKFSSYLIHTIIYWLRDSLNYQTHSLNLVHKNSYINKIKISRLYIQEFLNWNITECCIILHVCIWISEVLKLKWKEYSEFWETC